MLAINFSTAQKKTKIKKAKDTIIKTEVVEVITSYTPKITDAFKIKRKPVIKLSKKVQRKSLNYQIKSLPVASGFTPGSGVLKGIDLGDRERLFNNYLSSGFGNNTTPLAEMYFQNTNAFEYEYGGKLSFISSTNPVQNAVLNSSYYNAGIDLFLKQEMYYFDWKAGLKAFRNKYNWYGLPTDIDFKELTINAIEESQVYQFYNIFGFVYPENRNTKEISSSVAYFRDALDSNEIHGDAGAKFTFPLGRFGLNSEDAKLAVSTNFITGNFDNTYNNPTQKINYSFLTAGIHPSYAFSYKKLRYKIRKQCLLFL